MNSSLVLSGWGKSLAKHLIKSRQKFKPENDAKKWNIVRGDLVKVIQGPQAGQQGRVLKVIRPKNRLIIDGVNMVSDPKLYENLHN